MFLIAENRMQRRLWGAMLASSMLFAGLLGTAWFYRVLVAAEDQAIERHVAHLSS